MAVPKSLILMTWNANSLRGKQAELEDVMTFYDVDIVLIQETFLKPSHRGDFNAHHPTWGCFRANSAGNAIVALSAELGYGLALPDEPTHHPSTLSQGAARILDFFILQEVNRDSEVRVLDELDSDHRPVLLKLGNCATTQASLTRFRRKTDWKNYQSLLLISDPIPKIITPEQLEEAINSIHRGEQSMQEGKGGRLDLASNEMELISRGPKAGRPPFLLACLQMPRGEDAQCHPSPEVSGYRKFRSFDGISITQLKKLPHKQLAELANIINSIMRLQHFPASWKHAHIAVKPKKGAKSSPSDYRPINPLSAISKLAERAILYAINSFTKNPSIKLPVWLHTSIMLLTNVWHDGLFAKCVRLGLPEDLTALIKSYLSDRSFQVKIRASLSSRKQIDAGVPQGSPLAPALFNFFISDMPRKEHIDVAFYADDTAFFTAARFEVTIHERLQKQLDYAVKCFKFWRLQINPLKTQAIIFHKKRYALRVSQLKIDTAIIPWLDNVTYLGLHFDRRFGWHSQIQKAIQKADFPSPSNAYFTRC
ncbi:hypothetical protein GWI33_022490 [Rhynchophorus ferrugineus]|uniref:Reverse transcriptase domain-containing protein n=1 Tax=Rhynchophorus ferrugineus TaxID=354439 RepID=A0A834IND8_RHYFE|nr:hypothetical protein GWI33_022490 [Rhynchophorus ferrugineus]